MRLTKRQTLWSSLKPLAVVAQLLGALPLSGVLSCSADVDVKFRWLSWPVAYCVGLHTLCTTVNHLSTEDPWYEFIQPYFHCRNAVYVLSFAAMAKGLPALLSSVEEVDARLGAARPLERWLGRLCAAGNAALAVATAGLLGLGMPRPSARLFVTSPLVGNAPVAARAAAASLFLLLCDALRRRLAALARSHLLAAPQRGSVAELERCRLLHALLATAASRGLTAAFGPLLAATISSVSIEIMLDLYQVVYGNKGHVLTFNVVNVIMVCSIADFGQRLSTVAQEIVDDLKRTRLSQLDVESQKQVVMFMAQLSANPVQVSASGFCVVNRGMLVSILMAMTTYFIAMVQSAEDLKKYTGIFLDQRVANETYS